MRELQLAEIQRLQTDMLAFLDALCAEHGLRYSLCAGTLLGAVRHAGFVPWDDDADVFMPRPDYDRLLALAGGGALGSGRYGIASRAGGFARPFARVLDRRTRVEQVHSAEAATGDCLWIDVFPIDGVPEGAAERDALFKRAYRLKALIGARYAKPFTGSSAARALAKTLLLKPLAAARGMDALLDEQDALARGIPFDEAETVGSVAWCTYGARECLPRSAFDQLQRLPFGSARLCAFSCAEEYLANVYGNWRELPPESKRKPAHLQRAWLLDE